MKKKIITIFLSINLIALSSCSLIYKNAKNNETKESEIITTTYPESEFYEDHYKTVKCDFEYLNYNSIGLSSSDNYLKSQGEVNILVLPIEIKGYEFDSNYTETLNKAFNGDGINDTNYWESLKSFYYKSSYGKLNINSVIAEKYETNLTMTEMVYDKNDISAAAYDLTEEAFNNYKLYNDTKIFDNYNDGYIDAVIAVYSAPSYKTSIIAQAIDEDYDLFWAYCTSMENDKNINDPSINNFMWISLDFFKIDNDLNKLDCHTVIHETGHLLGLDDYYSYDEKRNPLGGLDMMDYTVGDHSAFSKLALGWIDPIYAYGNARLTLRDFEKTGDCCLFSYNWNGTAFDEYLLIELYTPNMLNELDSTTRYLNSPLLYQEAGIKITHVDNRIVQKNNRTNKRTYLNYSNKELDYNNYKYVVGASNSKKYDDPLSSGYDLISLIENVNTGINISTINYSTDESLYHANDIFDINNKKAYFPNKNRFNNYDKLNITIEFGEFVLDDDILTCEINIKKIY